MTNLHNFGITLMQRWTQVGPIHWSGWVNFLTTVLGWVGFIDIVMGWVQQLMREMRTRPYTSRLCILYREHQIDKRNFTIIIHLKYFIYCLS